MRLDPALERLGQERLVEMADDHQAAVLGSVKEGRDLVLDQRKIDLVPARTAGKGDAEKLVLAAARPGRLHRLEAIVQRRLVGEVPAQIDRAAGVFHGMLDQPGRGHGQDVGAVHHRQVFRRLGNEVILQPRLDRVHVLIGLVGRDREQRVVEIVEHRQFQAPRLVAVHLGHRHGLQPVFEKVGGVFEDMGCARHVLVMRIGAVDIMRLPEFGQLLDPILAALRQVHIGDQGNLAAPIQNGGSGGNVKSLVSCKLLPDAVEIEVIGIDRAGHMVLHLGYGGAALAPENHAQIDARLAKGLAEPFFANRGKEPFDQSRAEQFSDHETRPLDVIVAGAATALSVTNPWGVKQKSAPLWQLSAFRRDRRSETVQKHR